MKRMLSFLLVLAVCAVTTPSFAGAVAEKFKGGVKSVVMSPVQVSDKLMEETKNAKFYPFAFAGGLLKGVFYMGKDIVTGFVDIVTSPLEAVKK
ncbi:MAG: hypothetical protein HYZ86_04230 [Candidatus Omnitrophica bacterium]|nr:hypothetical protein [Candidatus Omnitrophota bacterium]